MLRNCLWNRRRPNRRLLLATPLITLVLVSLWYVRSQTASMSQQASPYAPLTQKYINEEHGEGGGEPPTFEFLPTAEADDK